MPLATAGVKLQEKPERVERILVASPTADHLEGSEETPRGGTTLGHGMQGSRLLSGTE